MNNHRKYFTLAFIVIFVFLYGCSGVPQSSETPQVVTSTANFTTKPKSNPQNVGEEAQKVNLKADNGAYKGLPTGFTTEGFPYLGSPDALVTLEEYSDFLCPYCGRHSSQTMPLLLEEYIQSGQVKYVFRDMPLVGLHPTSPVGHVAARCAAEQGAELFWKMHDELFMSQAQWGQLRDPSGYVAEVAAEIGANMDVFTECVNSDRAKTFVDESIAYGRALGFNGTPSFQVIDNGSGGTYSLIGALPLNTFASYIDPLLAGEKPAEPGTPEPTEQTAELPYWAKEEGLKPDPERPGYTMAGDPYKGNPEAKVVVVEFADFQCPACAQHALEIQPVLDKTLVDTGEIMWVFKNLPLKEHSQAIPAAMAAECAGEQGHFWEIYHRLFDNMDNWAMEDADTRLQALVKEEGLDMKAFSLCFNGREALERVVADMYDAQGITEITPVFIVLSDGRGALVSGSRPADQFERLIRSRLGEGNN